MNAPKSETSASGHVSRIIAHYLDVAIKHTKMTKSHYCELVSHIFAPVTRFLPVDEVEKIEDKNRKKMSRYLDGSNAMPADIIPACILALPAPYQGYANNDIAKLVKPEGDDEDIDAMRLIKELSEGIQAITSGHASAIEKELRDVLDVVKAKLGVK